MRAILLAAVVLLAGCERMMPPCSAVLVIGTVTYHCEVPPDRVPPS